ncbi:MAG: hypothetical protein JKY60_18720 [Kordiimonadaceae bacterium]|nr:hypothetical protein [Kordiimonadaceae bacterium]
MNASHFSLDQHDRDRAKMRVLNAVETDEVSGGCHPPKDSFTCGTTHVTPNSDGGDCSGDAD